MEDEFSPEEINQIARAARVWALGFTQEQLQELVNSQHHLADSRFCEAAWGIVRLEQEKGVSCTEVLDACERLLQEKVELEQKVSDLEARLETLKSEIREAQDRQREVEEATERGKGELQAVQAERQREEKELSTFRKKADKQKERIEEELEQHRQEANVTKEEIIIAGQLKAEVGKYGFSLDLVLGLSQQFKGYENIKDEVAKVLKEGQTVINYIEQAEERKKALETDIKGLAGECQQFRGNLSQLRADVAFEEKVRQFYHRYQGVGVLMEQLASWRNIFFVRCSNPLYAVTGAFDRSTSGARFWTEKRPLKRCPCCNYPDAVYDEEPYQALNWAVGEPLKLQLGE